MLKIYKNLSSQNLNSRPALSLIIAFYNNLNFLKLVWASIEKQSLKNFEVLICDDGSRQEIVENLHTLIQQSPIPTQHLWHEDCGFRKNRIMNYGIREANSDYIVFIDGDCVLHPEFLKEHSLHRKENAALAGRRLDLSPSITQKLTTEKIKNNYIEKNLWWIIPVISLRKDNNGPKGIYLKNHALRRFFNHKPRGIVGCNFSVSKKDLLAINGFDNRYEAPGTGEDSDLEYRLGLSNIRVIPFCHAAVQFHLWHKLQDRPNKNESLFQEVKSQGKSRTSFGITELE